MTRQKKHSHRQSRRGALKIMGQLIGLVKPLLHIMLAAIVLGVLGYLCAIFLTILAVQAVIHGLLAGVTGMTVPVYSSWLLSTPIRTLLIILVVIAVLRGVLHYAEQYCNHFIAFKLLAIIRHKVFAALRRLCPAKLEGRDKGNLISIITTDIELLEVFYAHTISPIAIAALTSVVMVLFIGHYHVLTGLLALAAYVVVGVIIPVVNGKRGSEKGMTFRNEFGDLNSFVLDSLRGLDETIQYGQGEVRKAQIDERSKKLGNMQKDLSRLEGSQRSFTNLAILAFSFGMLFLTIYLYQQGAVGFDGILTCTVAMMGSFGPVVALSSLSNNLNQTLASGERVLSILEEEPLVEENLDDGTSEWNGAKVFTGAEVSHVTFAYGTKAPERDTESRPGYETEVSGGDKGGGLAGGEDVILKDYSLTMEPGRIIGIHGASGSGKSTLLKLLMRFWDVDQGNVSVAGEDVKDIPTGRLRDAESYVTQETHLFHDSIANNIAIGKPGASREEIMEAAKKASIHDFIMSLPKGYDTEVGELGDTLSGGEKQRIGIARAFLHDAPFLLMDEPTSNLDSLNEGIILKSLKESCEEKTVVLVSHRRSTMNVADVVYEMDNTRKS